MRTTLVLMMCGLAACDAVAADPDPAVLPDAQVGMPDAQVGLPDAAIMVPDPPPPPPRTAAVVRYAGTPITGVWVVFHGADGLRLADGVTDLEGRATAPADLPDNAIVSVLSPLGDVPTLYTFHGVPRGTAVQVNLGDRPRYGLGGLGIGVPDSVSSLRAAACATGKLSAGKPGTTIDLSINSDCLDAAGRLSVVTLASHAGTAPTGGVLTGFPFLPGSELAMPPQAPLLAGSETIRGTLTGPRGEVPIVRTERGAVLGDARFVITSTDDPMSALPVAHEDLAIVPGVANASLTVSAIATRDNAVMQTTVEVVGSPLALPSTVDLGTAVLPFIDASGPHDISGIEYLEAESRPIAHWASTSALAADYGRLEIEHYGEQGERVHRWIAVVPSTGLSVKAPELPKEFSYWQTPDHNGWLLRMTFVDSDVVTSYAESLREANPPRLRPGRARRTTYELQGE